MENAKAGGQGAKVEVRGEGLEVFEPAVLQLGPLTEHEAPQRDDATEEDDQGCLVDFGLLVTEPEPSTCQQEDEAESG